MATSTRCLAALLAVPLLALALAVNLGFYTLPSMLAVLAAGLAVTATCLLRPRLVKPPAVLSAAAMYLPALAAPAYLIWLTLHESSALKVQLEAPLAALGALVVLLAYLVRRRPADLLSGGLIGSGVLLTGTTALSPQLRFGAPDDPSLALVTQVGLLACVVAGYLVWLSFLAQPVAPVRRGGWHARWGLLLLAGLGVRALAVIGSPDPIIDVHTWLNAAPQALLEGRNPYAVDYQSPYGTARAEQAGIHDAPVPRPPTYPPLVVLTGLPAALLGLDARWLNVLGELVAALVLLLAGRSRGRPDLGLLASGLYLSLPRAAFMMEQAWFEPQLAALLGLALLVAPRRPWAAGVALGAFTAGKQYSLVLLAPLVRALLAQRRLLVVALGTALAITVPFVLWSPVDFWSIVVAGHLHRPVVYHALTLAALLRNAAGVTVPPLVLWALAAVALAGLAWRAPRFASPAAGEPDDQGGAAAPAPWELCRAAPGEAGPVLFVAAALLVFCLCHTQGFPNYYYLALFLLLFGLATADREGA